MPLNLNRNTDADFSLKERNIKESIEIFGSPFTYLYTEPQNKDTILRDFTHLKLSEDQSKVIYLMSEDQSNWEGSVEYNMFGLENLRTITLFMPKATIYELYPDFVDNGYSRILNSLLVTQGGNILEITDISAHHENINNTFLSNEFSVWKLTTRIYHGSKQNEITPQPNAELADTVDVIDPSIVGRTPKPMTDVGDELMDLDAYFNELDSVKEEQDTKGDAISNTDSVFGSLG